MSVSLYYISGLREEGGLWTNNDVGEVCVSTDMNKASAFLDTLYVGSDAATAILFSVSNYPKECELILKKLAIDGTGESVSTEDLEKIRLYYETSYGNNLPFFYSEDSPLNVDMFIEWLFAVYGDTIEFLEYDDMEDFEADVDDYADELGEEVSTAKTTLADASTALVDDYDSDTVDY